MRKLYGLGTFFSDDTGQRYFYPYGPFGRGYLLAPEREEDVQKILRRAFLLLLAGMGSFVVSYFTVWTLNPDSSILGTILPVLVLLGIAYLLRTMRAFERLTSGLQRSDLPKQEVLRLSARNTPWAVLLIQPLLIGWAMFIQLSSLLKGNGASLVALILTAAFWLALASLVVHQIWVKLVGRPAHGET